MDNYLTVKQTASVLKIHPNTVYKLIRAGRLLSYQPNGFKGRVLIKESDLKKYVEGEG